MRFSFVFSLLLYFLVNFELYVRFNLEKSNTANRNCPHSEIVTEFQIHVTSITNNEDVLYFKTFFELPELGQGTDLDERETKTYQIT